MSYRTLRIAGLAMILAATPRTLLAAQEESWVELQKMVADDRQADDELGKAVAISAGTIVVGAWQEDDLDSRSGAAYVFEEDPSTGVWVEVVKLLASDGGKRDHFGNAVAIDLDTIVVGSYRDDESGPDAGAAYVYERDPDSGAWVETAKLRPPGGSDLNDWFGQSVAVDGDTIVVGALETHSTGSAYVYERDPGTGQWVRTAHLTGSTITDDDRFGTSVAISGDTLIAGAPGYAFAGGSGLAYLFERDPGTGAWVETRIFSSTAITPTSFGESVAIDGDLVVIGSNSAEVDIFERDPGTGTWVHIELLRSPDGSHFEKFGAAVSISGETIAIGEHGDTDLGDDAGSVFVFQRDDSGLWSRSTKVLASDGSEHDLYGDSVSIWQDRIAVGARQHDETAADVGSVYVVGPTIVDPLITFTGSCPGKGSLSISGLTPKNLAEIFRSPDPGTANPGRRCPGTDVLLDDPESFAVVRTNEFGEATQAGTLPEGACGTLFQVVDMASCASSDVEVLP